MPLVAPKTATLSNKKNKSRQKTKKTKNAKKVQLLAPPKTPLRPTSPINVSTTQSKEEKANFENENQSDITLMNEEREPETEIPINDNSSKLMKSAPMPVPTSSSKKSLKDGNVTELNDFSLNLNDQDIILDSSPILLDSSPLLSQPNSLSSMSFSTAASTSLSSAVQPTMNSDIPKQVDVNMDKFPANVNINVNTNTSKEKSVNNVTIDGLGTRATVGGDVSHSTRGNNHQRTNSLSIETDDSETKSEGRYFTSSESKEPISPPWNAYEKKNQTAMSCDNIEESISEREMSSVNVHKHDSEGMESHDDNLDLSIKGDGNDADTDLLDLGSLDENESVENFNVNDKVCDKFALMKTSANVHVGVNTPVDTCFTGQILNPVEVIQQHQYNRYNCKHGQQQKPTAISDSNGCPSPKELSASPGTSSGFLSQLASRIPSNIQTPTMNLTLEDYVPEFIKDYTAGGAEQRTDALQRDKILWTHFQTYEQRQHLLLGYTDGFHIWDVNTSDATRVKEVVSIRDGSPVRIVQYLANPNQVSSIPNSDVAANSSAKSGYDLVGARPLLAVCKAEVSITHPVGSELGVGAGLGDDDNYNQSNSTSVLYIYSLKLLRYVKEVRFKSKVLSVQSNKHSSAVVIALRTSIHGLCAYTLEKRFSMNCYPSPSENGVLALGSRWLAYAGYQPVIGTPEDEEVPAKTGERSGENSDLDHAWKKTVATAAKGLASGLSYLSDWSIQYVQNHVAGNNDNRSDRAGDNKIDGELLFDDDISLTRFQCNNRDEISKDMVKMQLASKKRLEEVAGIVVVSDLSNAGNLVVISNFRSHEVPIESMTFDPTGSLLVTTPVGGHTIHIHRIIPRKTFDSDGEFSQPSLQRASHRLLYSLERGMTSASIRHIAFSDDLRWISATSSRGTTHVYAISPSGGQINAYSHPVIIVHKGKSKHENHAHGNTPSGISDGVKSKQNRRLDTKWKDKVVSVLSHTIPNRLSGAGDEDLLPLTGQVLSQKGDKGGFAQSMSQSQSPGQRIIDMVPIFRPPPKDYLSLSANTNEKTPHPVNNLKLYALARVRQPVYMDVTLKGRMGLDDCSTDSISLCSTPSRTSESSQKSICRMLEDIPAPVSAAFVKGAAQLVVTSSAGMVDKYDLIPLAAESDRRKLNLRVIPNCTWDVCRRRTWPEFRTSTMFSSKPKLTANNNMENKTKLQPKLQPQTKNPRNSTSDMSGHKGWDTNMRRANWLSNVEIQTHARPLLPVWASPQIRFMVYTPEEEKKEFMPLFVDKIMGSQVEIRGEGPLPLQNNNNDMEDYLKFAIDTPAKFQNFEEASEKEINETVLVYDDDDEQEVGEFITESDNLNMNDTDEDEDIFSHDYEDDVDYEYFKNIDKFKKPKDKNE